MERGNKEKRDEAEKMYLSGLKLVDIAKKLDIPEGTVRRWKSTNQSGVKESERSGEKSER